jgi:uncharacterized pyridoxal phosphate-containing UPF0001 family protein
MTLTEEVAERVAEIRVRIRDAGGDPAVVTLVAVTKGFGPEVVHATLGAGVVDVAESYAQELVRKAAAVSATEQQPVPRWHFVGRLQTNKVARLAPLVQLWQSVDRPEVVHHLARRSPSAQVLVQVDVSGAPGRGGCAPADVPGLVVEARQGGLDVSGLMAVGRGGAPEGARRGFRTLAGLADDLGLAERSMGMSGDLEVAVEEGSTMVRVGRALFGPRPERDPVGHAPSGGRN